MKRRQYKMASMLSCIFSNRSCLGHIQATHSTKTDDLGDCLGTGEGSRFLRSLVDNLITLDTFKQSLFFHLQAFVNCINVCTFFCRLFVDSCTLKFVRYFFLDRLYLKICPLLFGIKIYSTWFFCVLFSVKDINI